MTVYPNAIDGYASLPVLVDLVSPVRAADVNRLRNAIIAVEKELGLNPSGTYGTVRARLDALELGVGSGSGSGGGSAGTGQDFFTGMIETPTEKEYFLTTEIPYDGYIYSITTKAGAGTCTLTTKINGFAVGGTPNPVSTTEVTEYTNAPNTFVVGDEISIEVSGNTGCTDLTFTILMFVTPGGEFGEANTGANVGVGGVGPFKQKTGVTLEFRNINSSSNKISVGLDAPNNEIDIDVIESNLLLNNIGGILGISKGGTGQSTASAAFNALAPTTTKGDIIIRNTASNVRLGVGPDGYLLVADSTQSTGVRWGSTSFIGANTALSNLVSTAINQSLVPAFDDSLDLGSSSLRWRDLYLGPTSLRFVTTTGETGTVKNWKINVRETAGSSRGSLVVQESGTEYLYITPIGNVGIGVTDPSSILDINGVTTFRGLGVPPAVAPIGQGRVYYDGSINHLRFSENGGPYFNFGSGSGSSGANAALSNLTATNINTSLIPAIDDGYDLGLSSQRWRDLYLGPSSLHLISNTTETTIARDWKFAIAESAGATQGRLRVLEGISEYLSITPSGFVGIGTTIPIVKLDVRGDGYIGGEVNISPDPAHTGHALQIAGGNLGSLQRSLFVTGNLNPATAVSQIGALFNITSSTPVTNMFQYGLRTNLLAGNTSTGGTVAVVGDNQVLGHGVALVTTSFGNVGVYGQTVGAAVGNNAGISGVAGNSTSINYGATGVASTSTTGANVGVLGRAANGVGTKTGGYFYLGGTEPTFVTAALVADNGSTSNPIFIARDGSTSSVFTISDNGGVSIIPVAASLTSNWLTIGNGNNISTSGTYALFVDGNLNSTSADQSGVYFEIDSVATTGAPRQSALTVFLASSVPGYTQAGMSSGAYIENHALGTGINPITGAYPGTGNVAVLAIAGSGSSGPGTEIGVLGRAFSSTAINYGILGDATSTAPGASNIGVAGVGSNSGLGNYIGVLATLAFADPGQTGGAALNVKAALVADNNTFTSDYIFLARSNSVTKFAINGDGVVELAEMSAPGTPSSGFGRLYVQSDGYIYFKNDGGQEFNLTTGTGGGSGANTALSNLIITSINTDLLPNIDNLHTIGSPSLRWRDGYFGPTSVHLMSTGAETGSSRDWRFGIAQAAGSSQGRLLISESSSEYLSIDTSGNVGIGNTQPIYKLDVSGDGHFTGEVKTTGGVRFGDNTLQTTAATVDPAIRRSWFGI